MKRAKKRTRHTRYNGGVIRPRGPSFQAEFSRHGTLERKQFPKVELAKSWIDSFATDHYNRTASPSMTEIIEAREARALLPDGVSIITAARAYATLHNSNDPDRTIKNAREAYLREKESAGLRPPSLKQIRIQMRALPDPDRTLVAIDTDDIHDWLDATGTTGRTRDNYRRIWHGFFQWCMKRGYISRNPVAAITAFRGNHNNSKKHILSAAQAGKLLRTCVGQHPELTGWLACKMYAGLRSSEAAALSWEAINGSYLRVVPEVAKTRRQRLIPMCTGLKHLLSLAPRHGETVAPADLRRRIERLYESAGVPRRHNDMRDTWITYRYAETQDLAKTAAEAGNTAIVALESYRDLATPQAARAYFSAWKSVRNMT